MWRTLASTSGSRPLSRSIPSPRPVTSALATIRRGYFRRANYTLTDDLHLLLGRHNIAFGYHGEVSKVDVNNLFQQPGHFTFNANDTNDAIASFLFGYVESFPRRRVSSSMPATRLTVLMCRIAGRPRPG